MLPAREPGGSDVSYELALQVVHHYFHRTLFVEAAQVLLRFKGRLTRICLLIERGKVLEERGTGNFYVIVFEKHR